MSHPGLELTSLHETEECPLLSRPPRGKHGKREVGRRLRFNHFLSCLLPSLDPRVAENQRHPRAEEISEWEKEQGSLSMQPPYNRAVVTLQSEKPGLRAVDPMLLWPHLHLSEPESLTPPPILFLLSQLWLWTVGWVPPPRLESMGCEVMGLSVFLPHPGLWWQ